MKNLFTKLSTLLAATAMAYTGLANADTASVQVGAGYRQDYVNWKIQTPDIVVPDAVSHLKFRDMDIVTTGVKIKANLGCSIFFRTSFDYGWVEDGRLREDDAFLTAATSTVFDGGVATSASYLESVVHNRMRHSHVWDFDIGVGYPIQCWCDDFQIAPMVGFSYDRQFLRVHDHAHIYDGFTTAQEALLGIVPTGESNSKYTFSAWGPWLGLDAVYASQDCWSLYGEFELHFARLRRERDSNTGFEFFDDYERTNSGWGAVFKVGGNYVLCENWFVDASFEWSQYWSYRRCHDHFEWDSGIVRLDLGYIF